MKWWFSDYDGTISLNYDDKIDPQDINFINKWIASGNEFAVASGRMYKETKANLKKAQIPYNFIVSANGATVYNSNDELIYEQPIDMQYRKLILDTLTPYKNKFALALCEGDDRIVWHSAKVSEAEEFEITKKTLPREDNDEVAEKLLLNSKDLNLVYIFGNKEDLDKLVHILREQLPELNILRTVVNVLEIMNKNVSKAKAILWLAQKYGIKHDDIYVSGDGENDIEMLKTFKNSFAMQKAQAGVHDAANNVINNVFEIGNYIK